MTDAFESGARRRDARPPRRRLWDWLRGHRPDPKPFSATPEISPSPTRVGICCSGGGIRSACFNLGALQVLREQGELARTEYVSAVSGGCYMAASFATVASESPPKLLENGPPVYAPGSPEEQHLRNNSTYLAPGLGGKLRLLLRFLLGLVVNLLLVALAVYLLAVPLGWLLGDLYGQLSRPYGKGSLLVAGWTWWLVAGLGIGGVALAVPDLLFKLGDGGRGWRDLWSHRVREVWSYRLIAAATIAFFLLVAAPQLILWARGVGSVPLEGLVEGLPSVQGGENPSQKGTSLFAILNLGAILTSALGAAWAFIVRRRSFFAILAGGVAGPLVVLSAMLWFENLAATDNGIATPADFAIAALIAFLLWLFSDLTQWSLHPFYRRRLSSAFFVRRTGRNAARMAIEEIDYRKPLRLSTLDSGKHFPKLIVCAAANISDPGETPPGRAATPFVFTTEEVGGPLIGRTPVQEYEHQAARTTRDITLPAAVAMSGAAVSPAMGKKTIRALTFLMALSNLRLGVWVPNPRYVEELRKSRFAVLKPVRQRVRWLGSPLRAAWGWVVGQSARLTGVWGRFLATVRRRRATPLYLFREMLGLTKLNDRFLYVTDGGHYDNLGLIELLRRGCTTIYCFDGGGDPSGTFRALGEAVALARSDLGVEIDIDPEEIIPDKKTRISKTSVVVGRIRYRATPAGGIAPGTGDYMGVLVYCRTAVTEDAPWDVRAYHEKSRRFPYHSTLDQLFDDQKFEAYRALGAHTARKAVGALGDLGL
jgi:hypothetical protein